MKTLTSLSEQDDLLITPYLDKASLPTILRDLMPLASTSSQQDMLLLSVLTAAGSAMPRTYFTYGHTRRAYYPNLICFIEAMAAQGKSIASVGQQLLRKVNEDEPLFLAADSTHAAFVQHLSEQNGVGFCYESEGSVITDIWRRSGCNGYNALLRKAAEHEEYRVSRKTQPDIVIRNPRLSMLITGTFDQFTALVPSATNGLFSRIIPLVIRETTGYDPRMALTILPEDESATTASLVPQYAVRLSLLRKALLEAEQPVRFALTAEQATMLGEAFYMDSRALMPKLGENFHQTFARMTVHTLRIAHILTMLRMLDSMPEDNESNALETVSPLAFRRGDGGEALCAEPDFQSAMLIGRKLLLHAADAYTQINADHVTAIPAARGSFQQLTFLAALPNEFSTDECMKVALTSGIAQRSAERWLTTWVLEGLLTKPAKGYYRKVA